MFVPEEVRMATISYLTTTEFGFGSMKLLEAVRTRVGIRQPLIVSDRGLEKAGVLVQALQDIPPELARNLFLDTPENPTEQAVDAAVAQYRSQECDGVIAIGGGSSIDLAKGVVLRATHDGPLEQYAAINGGVARITSGVAPLIAVPTTAGTGSEVGRATLIVLKNGLKLGLISPYLFPKIAICDPALTLNLPPLLTAATGMDAFTHCVETYLSPLVNPPADAIALDGVGRAWKWIECAVTDGKNQDARWNMMMAALEGGLTFQKGLGPVHSLSHALGALPKPKLHHGTLNAIFLPAVLRFNDGYVGEKYAELRRVMNLPEKADLGRTISAKNKSIGLPQGLGALGVDSSMFEEVVRKALIDHSNNTSPRRPTAQEFAELLKESMS
jgi:4-hydroxybutyrate dehydrogenase